ncbi:MAG: hypothetical protein AAF799_22515 [Myxococcota bacterium]
MRSIAQAVLISCVLVLTACKGQPLPADKAEFAGHWVGPGMDLVIRPEGHVTYEKVEGKGRTSIEGPLQGWQDDDFIVGVMVVKTKFEVTETPRELDGEWTMVVNGVRLKRVEGEGQ